MGKGKADVVREAIKKITKRFGKGAIMPLGGGTHAGEMEVISTGSLCLDGALGVGGLPRGRVIEVYGPESSGKTTLALQSIAEAQKDGGTAAFVDAEHALEPVYCRKLGVDIERLLVSQPGCGEEALEIMDVLVKTGAVDMVVLDSVAALVPRAELEGDMGASHVGLQARLMSQALRKLTATISRSKTVVIFINQIREKIGVMFGNPETTAGGRALKFYSSVRLDVRRREILKEAGQAVGNRVRVKVVKNKVAPPFRETELEIRYGQGINRPADRLLAAVAAGVVTQRGAWFYFGKEKLGRGREEAWSVLRENGAMAGAINEQVRRVLRPGKQDKKTEAEPGGSAPLAVS